MALVSLALTKWFRSWFGTGLALVSLCSSDFVFMGGSFLIFAMVAERGSEFTEMLAYVANVGAVLKSATCGEMVQSSSVKISYNGAAQVAILSR